MWDLKALAKSGDVMKRCGGHNPPLTSFRLNNLLTPMRYTMEKTVEWIRQHG